jgi:hypothetical protein
VIVIANGARGADVVRLAQQVADIVLEDRLGPEPAKVSAEAHKALLGDYWSSESRMVYSLVDEGGELKLALAKAPMGLTLVHGETGTLVTTPGGLGEVAVTPGDDGLQLRFGAEHGLYRRLEPQDGDAEAFAAAATGRYRSDDADTEAVIEPGKGGLTLSLGDGHGRTVAPLIALSPQVAWTRPGGMMAGNRAAISLDLDGGKATGFRLNTARTRHLTFRRVD